MVSIILRVDLLENTEMNSFCILTLFGLDTLPIASDLTGTHRDSLVLASNCMLQPEIQPVSQGQIVSGDHPLLMVRHADTQL